MFSRTKDVFTPSSFGAFVSKPGEFLPQVRFVRADVNTDTALGGRTNMSLYELFKARLLLLKCPQAVQSSYKMH